ncbi:sigma-70 family RNA polymerase sigma factor [Clostridiaceae bacterium]|nr:sigma-70 family RNA polymerase sigma factor [Clostridiaceae bacterium]
MLTLQELKQAVNVPGDREKLPTARQLRNSGEIIAREQFGGEAELSVYRDGCVLYQVGNRSTVFSLHPCRGYFYLSDGDNVHLPEQYFDRKKWYLRLILEGEDRLNRNREERERSRNVSYSAVSGEWAVMEDTARTVIENLVERETVEEMLQTLTKKQKIIVCRYYLQEKNQMQIAEELGVSRVAVRDALIHAVRKIRKKNLRCSHGFPCGMADSGAAQ